MRVEVKCGQGLATGKAENGGEGGIRTPEAVSRLHGFQPCSLGHSDTSPAHMSLSS